MITRKQKENMKVVLTPDMLRMDRFEDGQTAHEFHAEFASCDHGRALNGECLACKALDLDANIWDEPISQRAPYGRS